MTIDSNTARTLIEAGRKHDEAINADHPPCTCNGGAWCDDECPARPWLDRQSEANDWFEANRRVLLDGYAAALDDADLLHTDLARLQPLLVAARQLAPNWRDTSGSAVSVDAITEGCEAVARAVEALSHTDTSKEPTR